MVGLKDEPMEYIRGNLTLSAANTGTVVEIQLPFVPNEEQTMFIHSFEIEHKEIDVPVQGDSVLACLLNQAIDAEVFIHEESLLAKYKMEIAAGAAGELIYYFGESRQFFNPPIMYVKPSIFVNGGSAGQAAAVNYNFRIGYTVDKISKADFIDALLETQ